MIAVGFARALPLPPLLRIGCGGSQERGKDHGMKSPSPSFPSPPSPSFSPLLSFQSSPRCRLLAPRPAGSMKSDGKLKVTKTDRYCQRTALVAGCRALACQAPPSHLNRGGKWEWGTNTRAEVASLVSPYFAISTLDCVSSTLLHCVNLCARFSAASIIY